MIGQTNGMVIHVESGHVFHSGASTRRAKKIARSIAHAMAKRAEVGREYKDELKLGRAMRLNPVKSTTGGLTKYTPIEIPDVEISESLKAAFLAAFKPSAG